MVSFKRSGDVKLIGAFGLAGTVKLDDDRFNDFCTFFDWMWHFSQMESLDINNIQSWDLWYSVCCNGDSSEKGSNFLGTTCLLMYVEFVLSGDISEIPGHIK